jgi:DHA2 family multidrug resistance protein-like MFS transporter
MPNMNQPAKATRREWIGLFVIALPCLLYSMDLTVLNLAVPALSADLPPSATQLLWIIDVYGFMVAGALITMGTLGDRIGRRRLLLVGAAAFGVTSIFAAYSVSAEMLIATRAALGLAGATVAPSTLSLIRNMFHDPEERRVAIGVWISSFSAGAAIGPLVGGLLLEHFSWGSVFLISVPVMVLLLVLGPVLLPEFRDPNAGRLDVPSAALSLAAVLPVIYGLKQIAANGVAMKPLLFIAAGLGAAAWFVRRQRRAADPLINLDLFRRPAFNSALAVYTLATFVAFGAFVFIAQYMQLVLGMSPLVAGLWTIPFAAAFIVGSMLTPALARRIQPTRLITLGLCTSAIGFGLMTLVGGAFALPVLVTAFVVYSLGLAPVFTLTTDVIVGCAPPERAGAAASISETGSEFGGALGIALLGSIGTALYRGRLGPDAPQGVPDEAWEIARDTLGAALSVAERLPADLGRPLVALTRDAFALTLHLTGAVAALVVLATAVVAWWLLARAQSSSPPSAQTMR